jgi:hypothetical protein
MAASLPRVQRPGGGDRGQRMVQKFTVETQVPDLAPLHRSNYSLGICREPNRAPQPLNSVTCLCTVCIVRLTVAYLVRQRR